MKRCVIGLNVRFFNVTIAIGHGRVGRSTGKAVTDNWSALRRMIELGNAVMKGPVASNLARRGTEKVTKHGFGHIETAHPESFGQDRAVPSVGRG